MSDCSFILDKCPMDESRPSASRASTIDSGYQSTAFSERPSTLDSRASNRTASSLSRDTPTNNREESTPKKPDVDKPGQ